MIAAERERMVLLRRYGVTYSALGEHFGMSPQRCQQICQRHFERGPRGYVDPTRNWVDVERGRGKQDCAGSAALPTAPLSNDNKGAL